MEHQEMKMKLLQSLMDQLDAWGAEKHTPAKKMAVEVSAPDEDKLKSGLDKAKEMLSNHEMPHDDIESDSEDSDEDRLRALLADSGEDEEDEEDSKPSLFGRRK